MIQWNEVRSNAINFSRKYESTNDEKAESQTFWNDFFAVFGIQRKVVATFERRVESIKKTKHFIDLFWPGMLLIEHKSRGKSLEKAESQAFEYIEDLIREGQGETVPRYVIVSDFEHIRLFDLQPDDQLQLDGFDLPKNIICLNFKLCDLHKNMHAFAFLRGDKQVKIRPDDPVNFKAVQKMTALYDALLEGNYPKEDLGRLLVRILFCLFAEDTSIFSPLVFQSYIETTKSDGSDLGVRLQKFFEVLNTPKEKRGTRLSEELADLPYVNGGIFSGAIASADFNDSMRSALLKSCSFNWSNISPAIFGSLFQGIMEPKERRQLGAHYTSESNILKLIHPLFLDELRTEFKKCKETSSTQRQVMLRRFHDKLEAFTFLDPACGCGNFLVITYRELRLLEIEVLKELSTYDKVSGTYLNFNADEWSQLFRVNVSQFYGIEIEAWPARIAETALWLTDHLMNLIVSREFGFQYDRLPIKFSPHILCANALTTDWTTLLPSEKCSYVLGNPPFLGGKMQSLEQKKDFQIVCGHIKNFGLLDFVCAWYVLAAKYIRNYPVHCAFVSTNSISQGEQVSVLWNYLLGEGMKIDFAHRTFLWQSEATGKAHVHVVIIGFSKPDGISKKKQLFDYHDIKGDPTIIPVDNISPYLIPGDDIIISSRSTPLCDIPEILFGNQPIDDGNFLMTMEEKNSFIEKEPLAEKFIRPYIGAREFINGYTRFCLWLVDIAPCDLKNMPHVMKRIEKVKVFRLNSVAKSTQRLGKTPSRFNLISHKEVDYLIIPSVSSERRDYIPMGFVNRKIIASNLTLIIPGAEMWHFGILTSQMHMAWVRTVGGRLKSDYRYSNKIVYNNFPWPEMTLEQKNKISELAQSVLNARQPYLEAGSTYAHLYDPLTMPPDLLKAHQQLDKAVDKLYHSKGFNSDAQRVSALFIRYQDLKTPLMGSLIKKTRKRK